MIGLYTALFGNYDTIQPTKYNGILFTDQKYLDSDTGWKIEVVEAPHPDLRYASRYYFDQSCRVMPDYEYTIMHGANATLRWHPQDLVNLLPGNIDLACCEHPRGNVYEEAKAVIRMGKDGKDVVNEQMERYRAEGFKGDDLSALPLMVRRNTPALREFEDMLWQEVGGGSCRDQLAFDYCRWKLNFPIFRLSGRWTNYLDMRAHKPKHGTRK